MQSFACLLTSLVFAAHALLGCGAHRTCEHRTAILAATAEMQVVHHCAGHQEGHDEIPSGHDSPGPCSHSACNYVKAETQRVDLSSDLTAFWATLADVDLGQRDAMAAAIFEPVCRADLSSTQLFVWHCALII